MAYIDLDTNQMAQLENVIVEYAQQMKNIGKHLEAHRAFRTLEAVRKAVPDEYAYEMIERELANGK
jgi:flagellar biosynthesis regulator FlbT